MRGRSLATEFICTPDVDPEEQGFDPARLARIGRHFAAYVDNGKLPCWLVQVARGGDVVHRSGYGMGDIDAGRGVTEDTIFRIYSMTKPITSVAAMMLYEEGAFELKDPVSKFIPSFADARVYVQGNAASPVTVPATEPVRIWHLLTHTAGLTYGFMHTHPVDARYRAAGFEWGAPRDLDLAGCVDAWIAEPLLFQPGAEWAYSVATDVLGRVVEVASGMTLDAFFRERIFEPLGMTDTAFFAEDHDRLAELYIPKPGSGELVTMPAMGAAAKKPPASLSGGGGLVSTLADYTRFAEMLRGRGALDGVRLLGSRTLEYMATNHLPGNVDLEAFGRPLFAETAYDGVGFGLGFSVMLDPAANKVIGSVGEFGWGGAASTAFWVDPVEDLTVIFLTQLLPSSTYPIRTELRQLVHQALVD